MHYIIIPVCITSSYLYALLLGMSRFCFQFFLHKSTPLLHFRIRFRFPGVFRSTSRSEKLRKNFRIWPRNLQGTRNENVQIRAKTFAHTSRSEKLCCMHCREREILCCHRTHFFAVWLKKIEFFRKYLCILIWPHFALHFSTSNAQYRANPNYYRIYACTVMDLTIHVRCSRGLHCIYCVLLRYLKCLIIIICVPVVPCRPYVRVLMRALQIFLLPSQDSMRMHVGKPGIPSLYWLLLHQRLSL